MKMNYNKENSQICMITRECEINKEKLHKEFVPPKYNDKRKWFFKTFSELEQNHIRNKWYNQMNEVKSDMCFFPWFEQNYREINTITR
jgi:hypothetical protein